jgi:hypothetical protein
MEGKMKTTPLFLAVAVLLVFSSVSVQAVEFEMLPKLIVQDNTAIIVGTDKNTLAQGMCGASLVAMTHKEKIAARAFTPCLFGSVTIEDDAETDGIVGVEALNLLGVRVGGGYKIDTQEWVAFFGVSLSGLGRQLTE